MGDALLQDRLAELGARELQAVRLIPNTYPTTPTSFAESPVSAESVGGLAGDLGPGQRRVADPGDVRIVVG